MAVREPHPGPRSRPGGRTAGRGPEAAPRHGWRHHGLPEGPGGTRRRIGPQPSTPVTVRRSRWTRARSGLRRRHRRWLARCRFVSLVVGLGLLVGGAGAIPWYAGRLPRVGPVLDVDWLPTAAHQCWWPYACALAGVLLVLLSLRWLVAPLPRRGPSTVALDGSGKDGRLEADLGVVAAQAAHALAALPGVTSAASHASSERGRHVLEPVATMSRDGDLTEVVTGLDTAVADLGRVLAPGVRPSAAGCG